MWMKIVANVVTLGIPAIISAIAKARRKKRAQAREQARKDMRTKAAIKRKQTIAERCGEQPPTLKPLAKPKPLDPNPY